MFSINLLKLLKVNRQQHVMYLRLNNFGKFHTTYSCLQLLFMSCVCFNLFRLMLIRKIGDIYLTKILLRLALLLHDPPCQ